MKKRNSYKKKKNKIKPKALGYKLAGGFLIVFGTALFYFYYIPVNNLDIIFLRFIHSIL